MFIFCFILSAFSGERMSKGDVLKEDSYVFSIQEAEDLKSRVIELEKKEKQLELYKNLAEKYEEQEKLFNLSDQYKEDYINNLKKINANNQLIIDTYMNKNKFSKYEKASYFVMGMGLSYSAIYMGTLLVE